MNKLVGRVSLVGRASLPANLLGGQRRPPHRFTVF
jgi:hypothetical protein